ncbi:MAG: translation initiation factor IF-2 [Nanoarchaeota archaeon]|nr:translation initiation factor IF-2 [Nanoarchaeota archaeon]MBU4124389.1 translation initiation factor IF-2 [Nanoarchaeota archaeon]
MIRQPVVCVLGHVDHGKTTLLDKIRETLVVDKEAGGITQAIGATQIPIETVKKVVGNLLEKLHIEITIPGLLIIDTPGHAAFTSLRKRGGSCADIAILIVDINEGFKPQTDESLEFLKQFKTPFLVAETKLDRIEGWTKHEDDTFVESYNKQPEWVRQRFDELHYKLVGQLSERGFEAERYDKVEDFKKTVAMIPVSGITGEGVPELLMILTGLSQQFLKKELEITEGTGRGSILEVKEVKGLGMTIDVILFDGEINKGDWLIIGGKEPIVTKIKALLKPPALREMRVERQFEPIDHVSAAAGIKISAPGLEKAVAGSPIAAVSDEKDIEFVKKDLMESVEHIEFESDGDGVIIKADNLGSLEALIHILKQKNIPIKRAEVGNILRRDILEVESVKDPLRKVIIAFNVSLDSDIDKESKDRNVKIIKSDIIYKLFDDYDVFLKKEYEKIKEEKLSQITMPAKIKLLRGMVFHATDPVVVGVEIIDGLLRSGAKLQKNGKEIGFVKALQSENVSVTEAKRGERVAVSIDGPTMGRQIKENDELSTVVTKDNIKILEELGMYAEAELAKSLQETKKK